MVIGFPESVFIPNHRSQKFLPSNSEQSNPEFALSASQALVDHPIHIRIGLDQHVVMGFQQEGTANGTVGTGCRCYIRIHRNGI